MIVSKILIVLFFGSISIFMISIIFTSLWRYRKLRLFNKYYERRMPNG